MESKPKIVALSEETSLEELEKKMQERIDQVDTLNSELKAILGNMRQGLIFIQSNGLITLYNPAAEILIGIEDKKIIGESVFKNFPDDFFGFSLKEMLLQEKAPSTKIREFRSLLGIDRVMEVETTYIDEPKENKGLLILLRDITEFHRLQVELARAERFKTLGELSSHIVHAIRNPLTGIRGFASLIQSSEPNPKFVGHILEGIDALNQILNEILEFSRPYSAKTRKLDLVPFLKNIESRCNYNQNVEVQFLYSATECPLEFDPILLERALWNLIHNSFEAMPNGGALTLSLSEKNGRVVLGIADTGSGIPQENLDKIFQPFFTTKPKGNGFGMTEVEKIMDAHQGKIEISSKENEGTFISLIFYR